MECNVERQPLHMHLKYPKSSHTHNQYQLTSCILDTHDLESLPLIVGMNAHRNFDAFDFCDTCNKQIYKHYSEISTKKTHHESNNSTISLCCVVFEIAVFYQTFGCILQHRHKCKIMIILNYPLKNSTNRNITINITKINIDVVFCIVNCVDVHFSCYK